MATFFGFAVSDSMFQGDVVITRSVLSFEDAKEIAEGAIPCLNPSHKATIDVMVARGITVEIPEKPPVVSLDSGDSLLVMGVRGLPRLTDRHEYTPAEIAGATFTFSLWEVK